MTLLPFLLSLALPFGALQEPEAVTAEASASVQNATERYAQLEKDFDAAYQDWMTEARALFKAAQESGEELKEYPEQPSVKFYPAFMEAAKDYAGTDDAVPFLLWVVEQGLFQKNAMALEAIDILSAKHLASAKLDSFGSYLPSLSRALSAEKAKEIVTQIEKVTPSDSLRAWAVFARLNKALTKSEVGSKEFEAAKAEMSKHLAKVDDESLHRTYRSEVEVRELFSNGMEAPEIVGVDLEGTAFKLSDYRGKVVFLDFWGDW